MVQNNKKKLREGDENQMTTEERNQKIELIVARTRWSRKVFENKTDEQLEAEYNRIMEERE